ncbi:MAG: ATP-binding protein [Planctomycetes bacterium]|nr:ATP-binding protein [Planctomycetota bacterium]
MNRQKEISVVNKAIKETESVFIVIYGRRRCGKSTLLQNISRKQDVYYLADQREAPLQRHALANEIERTIPGFAAVQYPSWDIFLASINDRIKPNSCLILDEFPYMVQSSPELPSIIQNFLDSPVKKNLNLIICGSSQRMMRSAVLDTTAPLYGRADIILKIEPLSPGWITNAFPTTAFDAVKAYAIFGGVPRYWELARNCKTVDAAIKQLIFDKNGILHEEPMRLLLDDMRSAAQPYSILSLIGHGCHRLYEIAGRLGKPANSLTRPLSTLIDLGYVRRELPFGESVKSTKRTLYKINDPFLSFYFRFVLPNKSLLEMGLTEKVYNSIKQNLTQYISTIWEDLSRHSVPYINIGNIKWGPAYRWWGSGTDNKPIELDIVAESMNRKHLLIGEAKWRDTTDIKILASRLESTADNLPLVKGRKIVFAFWLRQYSGRKTSADIISASDVLNCLK